MKRNWEYKKLGDVCEILNGYAFKSQEYVDHGIRVIRITNVQKGCVIDDDPKFYPLTSESSLSNYMLVENDLLMSLTGNVGRVGLLGKEFLPAALNQRVACLRIRSASIDKKFLFHILNSDKFEKDCIFNASGIAQKNMSTRWLGEYVIPVPPLEEQSRIVAELDLLTGIIDKQNAQLKELDNLAQAIFYDMFGDPIENPKGWEVKKLGDVAQDIFAGGDKPEDCSDQLSEEYRYPVIANGVGDRGVLGYSKEYRVGVDAVTVGARGASIGNCRICKAFFTPVVRLITIIPGVNFDIVYLFYAVQLLNFNINGAGQAQLTVPNVKSQNVVVPPLSLQQSFAEKIQSIEKQKETIRASIADTQKLLDYTMDKYFG